MTALLALFIRYRALLRIVLLVGGAVLLWLGIRYYWKHPELLNGTAAGYKVRAEKGEYRVMVLDSVVLAKDSVIADRDSANSVLSATIKQAEAYAIQYQREKDSLKVLSDTQIGQMSYLQQVSDLFKRLYQRGTLAKPKTGTPALILTDSVVVGANLKTAADLDISEQTGKKLQESISAKDARIEQLRIERLAKNRAIASVQGINQERLKQKSKGIVRRWVNAPQIRYMKAVRDSLQRALVTGESELEKALNQ
ncbi:hypothetical protein [Spirosoma spitsbergense]|uniref:hypothetical protein n=1 Tax=Spirosoma spitsbergense TaxID=431554 RepID=UPI000372C4B7|nr:hypothetical protein [Spirosoma spitsbergense]